MYCSTCEQKPTCTKICESVEKGVLRRLNHSLTSVYLVYFVDPDTLVNRVTEPIYPEWVNIEDYVHSPTEEELEELNTFLHDCINKLKSYEKDCILLYYGLWDATLYTQTEIAKMLHVSQNTVKYHLKGARNKLKLALESCSILKKYNVI